MGNDQEDGPLSGASLTWSSDRDGFLGNGAVVSATLSVGTHLITLLAEDGGLNSGQDTVEVTVLSDFDGDGIPDSAEPDNFWNPDDASELVDGVTKLDRSRGVTGPPTGTPGVEVHPDGLNLLAEPGNVTGKQILTIRSTDMVSVSWTASAEPSWLNLGTASGTTLGVIDLTGDASGLSAGVYVGAVHIQAAALTATIPVTLTVLDRNLDASLLVATIDAGPANPTPSREANFTFSGNAGVVAFECQLDGGAFSPCSSPQPYTGLVDGAHTFQLRAKDAGGRSGPVASFSWTVVNAAPVANGQTLTTPEETPIAVVLGASDANGDELSFELVAGPAQGTLSGALPNLTYTPNQDYNGPDRLRFKVSDGVLDSNLATVEFTVTAVNDPPVADNLTLLVQSEQPSVLVLQASDVDGDALQYTVASQPAHGTLSGLAPNLTYQSANGFIGGDSFTFTVADGNGGAATGTVTLTVTADGPPAGNSLYLPLVQR
jgi:hypothetical protein